MTGNPIGTGGPQVVHMPGGGQFQMTVGHNLGAGSHLSTGQMMGNPVGGLTGPTTGHAPGVSSPVPDSGIKVEKPTETAPPVDSSATAMFGNPSERVCSAWESCY